MNAITENVKRRTIYMIDGGAGQQYIGQTTKALKRRLVQHKAKYRSGKDIALYRAVREHAQGWNAFPIRFLMEGEWTGMQADAVETWYIHFHDTFNNGLNEQTGGVCGWHPSPEMRMKAKIAAAKGHESAKKRVRKNAIKAWRLWCKGYTQKAIAGQMGINPKTVGRWLNKIRTGEINISI